MASHQDHTATRVLVATPIRDRHPDQNTESLGFYSRMTFSTAGNCHPLLVASVYDHYLDLRPTIHPLARVCISPCCKLSLVYKGTKLGRAFENEAVSQSDSEHAHLVPGGTRTGDQHTSPPNFEARAFWRNSFAFTPWVNKCLK